MVYKSYNKNAMLVPCLKSMLLLYDKIVFLAFALQKGCTMERLVL